VLARAAPCADDALGDCKVAFLASVLEQRGRATAVLQTGQGPAAMALAIAVRDRTRRPTSARGSAPFSWRRAGYFAASSGGLLGAGKLKLARILQNRIVIDVADPIAPWLAKPIDWVIAELRPNCRGGPSRSMLFGKEQQGEIAAFEKQI
ncbi:unnamed protein product, partial [Prorocentrum cordatum]